MYGTTRVCDDVCLSTRFWDFALASYAVTGDISGVLDQVHVLVEPALREVIDRLHPDVARIASYHAGWTTETGESTGRSVGKRVRGALAILSAVTAGAAPAVGVPGAVAV